MIINVLVPCAVVKATVHIRAGRSGVAWRTRRARRRARRASWARATTHLAAHVGRDVGRSAALVVAKGQIAHIQLISHDCSRVVVLLLRDVDNVSFFR